VSVPAPVFALGSNELYLVHFEGSGFSIGMDGVEKPAVGFFTHRIVSAGGAEAAAAKARASVLRDWRERGYEEQASGALTLNVTEIEVLDSWFRLRSGSVFSLHCGG